MSKDGRCPYCNSDNVERGGAVGARSASSTKFPRPSIKFWRCNSCKRSFRYQGK